MADTFDLALRARDHDELRSCDGGPRGCRTAAAKGCPDVVAERVGTCTSPMALSVSTNTVLLVAGVLAASERVLTLRNHWLIDADTTRSSFT